MSTFWDTFINLSLLGIGEYQETRKNRFIGSGYMDDPYVLFLEEIKDWVTKRVSVMECNIETREMLKARVRRDYLKFSPLTLILGYSNNQSEAKMF